MRSDALDSIRDQALANCLRTARDSGALAGLHCCADQPIERMCRVNPDILSFDAHQGLERFFESPAGVAFLKRGHTVAWGLIPTWDHPDELEPASVFARWLHAAAQVDDVRALAQRAMITATCGLGLVSESAAVRAFDLAQRLAVFFKKAANG